MNTVDAIGNAFGAVAYIGVGIWIIAGGQPGDWGDRAVLAFASFVTAGWAARSAIHFWDKR